MNLSPAAVCLLLGSLSAAPCASALAQGDAGAMARPEGTRRVRVFLPAGDTARTFRDREVPGAEILSERALPFVDLALTPDEHRHLRDHGHACEERPDESWDAQMLPTEYTYARMVSELQAAEAAYPGLISLTEHTGATHDGRSIWEAKISDNVALREDEPVVFFVGAHHGGEMAGCDILMFWLDDMLAAYGTDPVKTAWVDDHEIRLIVIGNPDGWTNNETGITSGWRKNNRDNNGNGQFDSGADGVDINRNFDFQWSSNGSGSQSSSTYRGPAPGSEPEAQVCQDLLLANRPVVAVSFHMSGEVIIIPWTWNGQRTPDAAAYLDFAQQVGAAIPTQSGGGTYFAYEETNVGGYIDDYIYARTGGFCMTVEVTWSPSLGPLSDVVANNQGVFPVVFNRVAGPQVTGHVTDAVTGAPLAAKVELFPINTAELDDRVADATFGHYRWLTLPGNYTLRVSMPGYHSQVIPVSVMAGGPTTVDVALDPYFTKYGTGLAGSGGFVPDLSGSGAPVLGQAMALDLTGGLGGAASLFLLAVNPDSTPGLGGTILVAPPYFTDVVVLGGGGGGAGAGSGSLGGTVPNDASLSGLDFFTQVLVLDAGGPQKASLSQGLQTHVE